MFAGGELQESRCIKFRLPPCEDLAMYKVLCKVLDGPQGLDEN